MLEGFFSHQQHNTQQQDNNKRLYQHLTERRSDFTLIAISGFTTAPLWQIKSYTPCQKDTFKSAVVFYEKTDLCSNIIEAYWSLRNLSFSLSGRCAKENWLCIRVTFRGWSSQKCQNEFNISQKLQGVFEWFWYQNKGNTPENILSYKSQNQLGNVVNIYNISKLVPQKPFILLQNITKRIMKSWKNWKDGQYYYF